MGSKSIQLVFYSYQKNQMLSLLLFVVKAAEFFPYGVFREERYSEVEVGTYKIYHCSFLNLEAYDLDGGGGALSIHNQLATVHIYRNLMENCTAWRTDPAAGEASEFGYGGSAALRGHIITIDMTAMCQSSSNVRGGSLAIACVDGDNSQVNCSNVCIYRTKGSWGDFFLRWTTFRANSINWTQSDFTSDAGPIGSQSCGGITLDYSQASNITCGAGFSHLSDNGSNNSLSMCNLLYIDLVKAGNVDAGNLIAVENENDVWTIIRDCTMIQCTHHLKTKLNWMISKLVDIDECYVTEEDPEMDWDSCNIPCMVGNVTDADDLREFPPIEFQNMYSTRRFTSTTNLAPTASHAVLRGGLFVWLLNM